MMRVATLIALGALALTGSAGLARAPSGEQRLARMLEGRVAGRPMRCINAFHGRDVQVIDRVGIVYDDGKTVWVARADDPDSVRDRDILIVERMSGSNLCRDDVKRTVDRSEGFLRSVVFLGDFVPYTRAG
ncbi:MAG: hypothetical protein ABIP41_08790 [Croceibacterium sp.]